MMGIVALASEATTPFPAPIPGNEPFVVDGGFAQRATEDAVEAAQEAGDAIATIRIRNAGVVPLGSFETMAGAEMPVRLMVDTMTEEGRGNAVEVRLTVDPALATTELSLYASMTNTRAVDTRRVFERFFTNYISGVISLGHQGEYGQAVQVAARIPVPEDFDLNYFVFHTFDYRTNTYRAFTPDSVRLCANGFLHFTTERGGDVIITTGPLTLRPAYLVREVEDGAVAEVTDSAAGESTDDDE